MIDNHYLQNKNWHITNHICRVCLGRVLTRHTESGETESRCAECGVVIDGNHDSLCVCGIKMYNGNDARLRCVINKKTDPRILTEIVAELVPE